MALSQIKLPLAVFWSTFPAVKKWEMEASLCMCMYTYKFSIYTLSDLGNLSNLIGSLSRTIQQYSPPSEWIMCELGVFPFFFENDLLKADKILGLTFFRQEKTWKDSIRRFSIYCSWVLCSMDCLQLPCIRVEEAVSWTQRFLTRKFWLKNRSLFMTNKFKRKCLQKFYVSSKQEKEWYRKTTSYLEQPSRHFCQHFMRRTTQQTLLAINLASQQKTTKLYFSSQVRKQLTFNGSI